MIEPDERVIESGDIERVKAESARRTRRSFVVGGVAAVAGAVVLHEIDVSRPAGRLQAGLRKSLNFDANVARTVFDERGLAPVYPLSRAKELRLNGVVGMDQTLDLTSWRLQLAGVDRPEQSPLYAKDVTAWEYKYAGTMHQDQQALDVKSAPKSDAKLGPDDDQPEPVDGPYGPDGPKKTGPQIGPGVAPDVKNTPRANSLNPNGAVDSAAGAALAARMEAMAKQGQKKRNEGNAEAGASYSSLDIGTPGVLLAMSDLQKLPKVEMCLEFKCIEGWSEITQWGGYRLRDLMEMYPPAKINGREPKYVYMETPDGNYYGGYDLAAARHPQTMLVTEMSGQPLTQQHGAPMRLYMPIKYGYKQVKRVGLIAYTDQKPDDFWTKLGYDWYAGL
jgi:hypothetical protein